MEAVNTRAATKKLRTARSKAKQELKKHIVSLARLGQGFAFSIAPIDTGALVNNLVAEVKPSGFKATITSYNTVGQGFYRDSGRNPNSFSLPRYFASGGWSVSGSNDYMEQTFHMLKGEARKGVKLNLK